MEKINKIKSRFFEKKNEKSLARLTKHKKEKTQISKIKNEIEDLSTALTEISKIIGNIMNNYVPTNYSLNEKANSYKDYQN